ncbi:Dimethyladenosine transferase 1, mitochondrial [Bagarius yarrelli]|uniref:rRNA adenine N(6)-methyltransferase n=1 Tax=Bagarius yarrelli TaxID=175774 RepID=A0A556VA85_BAGYA|nr:Dimethyladenosine transferase 1, mitochondrial [Bagarius yarrelli]
MATPFRLPPLPTIREIIKLYNLRAQKQLSQNFLLDLRLTVIPDSRLNAVDKMVRQAGNLRNACVCEVGPGPGGLSRSILNAGAADLLLLEKDSRFVPGLKVCVTERRRSRHTAGTVIRGGSGSSPNRPRRRSYIRDEHSVPAAHHQVMGGRWLEEMSSRSGPFVYGRTRLTLTFQKEVAERLTASCGNKQRSRLSVMAQYLSSVHTCFTIPGRAFVPQPEDTIHTGARLGVLFPSAPAPS